MKFNDITPNEMYKIEFEDDYAVISVGDKSNRFQCHKEDEEQLSHMMEVIANSSGLFGTDIVDFECIFDKCSNHRFSIYQSRKLNADDSAPTEKSDSKAVILFIIGGSDIGLSDVNCIVNAVTKDYPSDTEIIFTAENSGRIEDKHYTLCVLE